MILCDCVNPQDLYLDPEKNYINVYKSIVLDIKATVAFHVLTTWEQEHPHITWPSRQLRRLGHSDWFQ